MCMVCLCLLSLMYVSVDTVVHRSRAARACRTVVVGELRGVSIVASLRVCPKDFRRRIKDFYLSPLQCEVALPYFFFFFSSRRRHTRFDCDWSSDVCSSD